MSGPRIGELFAGYGGLGMGVRTAVGGDVAWTSEIDPGACKILAHRFPNLPNHGDITTIDWSSVEPVDVLTGGFPCQDLSLAGLRKGLRPDTRSGLWTQFAYAIDQLRPSLVVAENVRGLLSAGAHSDLEPCPWCVGDDSSVALRALGAVLGDLADLGYDASWQGLRASDVGAPHGRFRVFVIAWPTADARVVGRERGAGLVGSRRPAAVGGEAGDHVGDPGGASAPHAPDDGRERSGSSRHGRSGSADHGDTTADADGARLERRRSGGHGQEVAQSLGDAAVVADAEGHPDRYGLIGRAWRDAESNGAGQRTGGSDSHGRGVEWGPYRSSIQRWERVTRPAPAPTEPNRNGQPRLSAAFAEWMMGLPAGWVTDVPGLTRNEQLKALGNGVVPQQATQALRLLLPDVAAVAA